MRHAAVAVVLFLAAALAALAQETRGSIVGKILDPTGAVVTGATVRVKNTNTNLTATVKTNETGA